MLLVHVFIINLHVLNELIFFLLIQAAVEREDFTFQPNGELTTIFMMSSTRSTLECATICMSKSPECKAFSYSKQTSFCKLSRNYTTAIGDNVDDVTKVYACELKKLLISSRQNSMKESGALGIPIFEIQKGAKLFLSAFAFLSAVRSASK